MSSNEVFEVIKPGMQTIVQDLGRTGYQRHGIVVSGAMDDYALTMGNFLVGNSENAAGLEMAMIGPKLYVKKDCMIALTGADMSPTVDGHPVPMWSNIPIKKGSFVEFGLLRSGCRAYLTVNGGIDVPIVMGSRSTYLRAEIGGYKGRALKKGDRLTMGNDNIVSPNLFKRRRRLSDELIPSYSKEINLRIIKGPQWEAFTEESKEHFLSSEFQISSQSDRMGYRLLGVALEVESKVEHITDPIPPGAIQVPSGGNPIILLADRQTTGGYPKIATVISIDLPKIAQGKPGDRIRFSSIDITESHRLLREQTRIKKVLTKLYLR